MILFILFPAVFRVEKKNRAERVSFFSKLSTKEKAGVARGLKEGGTVSVCAPSLLQTLDEQNRQPGRRERLSQHPADWPSQQSCIWLGI